MLQIPKLAKGGVINKNFTLIGDKENTEKVFPLNDKYYKIYKHTKNRRIKKKQINKSLILKLRLYLDNIYKNCGIGDISINFKKQDDSNE